MSYFIRPDFTFSLLITLLASVSVYAPVTSATDYGIRPLSDIVFYAKKSAPASTISLHNTEISAQISAIVQTIKSDVGNQVNKGDVLAVLDCTDYQLSLELAEAQISSAEADLQLANTQLKRTRDLFARKLTSQLDLDTNEAHSKISEASLQQQQIAAKQAQVNVERCKIKAPYNAAVIARHVSEGQLVGAGNPIFSLINSEQLELSARISLQDIDRFEKIREFTFESGKQYAVKFERSSGIVDTQSRNIEARFSFPHNKPAAGTAGRLHWLEPQPQIPASFIVNLNNELGIYIVDQQTGSIHFHALPDAVPNRAATIELAPETRVLTQSLGLVKSGDIVSNEKTNSQ
jgi:RND family efflux transporter MFP subunit